MTGETRWVRRAGLDADPLRGFGTVAVADPRGWSATTRRLLAAALPPLVIGLLVVGLTRSPDTVTSAPRSGATTGGLAGTDNATASVTPDDDCSKFELDDPDPVMDGQPGWPELACLNRQFIERPVFDVSTTFIYPEFTSDYLNEKDGARGGWTPPACTCRRLRVWWFGGSAAWGAFQRDEFTIPSQLAKIAHEQGVTLDITNYAMPAWSARRSAGSPT